MGGGQLLGNDNDVMVYLFCILYFVFLKGIAHIAQEVSTLKTELRSSRA